MKIIIVGGGSAGWLCAGWLSRLYPNDNVTLIESPGIPKIGVGESVVPHVSEFLKMMGVDEKDLMLKTGAIQKLGNRFVGWKSGGNEQQHFSFSLPFDIHALEKNIKYSTDINEWFSDQHTADTYMKLLTDGEFEKFDQGFDCQYHYMMNNVAPYDSHGNYLLNPYMNSALHINAELTADYVRDYVALPNGVTHIKAKVIDIIKHGDNIKQLNLDNGQTVTGDLFIDASGFHKILVKDWPIKEYKDNPIDSAWVCQIDYETPETEMVNYSQSIAQDYGWLFKLGLYHRMGTGYCYSSDFLSDEQARQDFSAQLKHPKMEPRSIKWNPHRLDYFGKGNTVAIGLSCGFVEPMEANALFVVVCSIAKLNGIIDQFKATQLFDYNYYNDVVSYLIDDIADFILVHYTLSPRKSNDFWKSMHSLGIKEHHEDLIFEKYKDKRNSMAAAVELRTIYPNYMWANLADGWGMDLSKWQDQPLDQKYIDLTKRHYKNLENENIAHSRNGTNNYQWLKSNVFQGLSSKEWTERFILNK
jgi:tryptophan halogenase